MTRPPDMRSAGPRRVEGRAWAGHRVWWVLLGLAVVAQLVVLYAPSTPGPPPPAGTDKLVHAAVFAAPTAAALLAGLPRALVLTVLLVHAPVSELLQWVVLPHRDGSVWDVVADVTGVLLGLAVVVVWRRLRR